MPGVRAKGQTLIGSWCDAAFVAKIDAARGLLAKASGLPVSRSQFCRMAIAETLRKWNIEVPQGEENAPDRAGKGGRKGPSSAQKPDAPDQRTDTEDTVFQKLRMSVPWRKRGGNQK